MLAAVLTPSALAVTGSVAVTASATGVACDGISNVQITLQTAAPPPEDTPLDLVIAIDDSGSLSPTDYNREKQAAAAFVTGLNMTGGVRKVGLLKFSDVGQVILPLSNNKTQVLNAINSLVQQGGFTNITDAIRDARTMVTTGSGAQAGADKVLLLITDGQNNREEALLDDEYNAFKAMPGEIFALGFGTASLAQLNAIASDPDATHVFLTPDSGQLTALAATIAETIQNPAATNVQLNAIAAAPFSPVAGSNSATAGTTAAVPGGFSWSISTLGTEIRTLSFQLQHSGNEDGAFAALSSLSGTFVDSDGNTQPISAASPAITVSGCNDAPTADAGLDQAIGLSGSPMASVALDGSGSSDPDPQDTLTYSWSEGAGEIATGSNPSVSLGLGSHLITLTVSDGRLSDTDEVLVTVTDPSPPAITPHVTGTLGDNGWYTSDIGISWTVVDDESPATTSGCDPSSVTSDTAGVSFTCSASSAGGSASETVSVKRDATAPVLAFSGNAGTYELTDTVAITCAASDAMSGLASSTCPGASGPATSFVGTNTLNASARDNAGNTASLSTSFTVGVTAAGLCELVEQFVEQAGVAHSLCVKLEHGSIGAFVNEVNAQRGKKWLSNDEADLLILLAQLL
ncbi:MAG TPA: VWA domain-containing protein [Gaiellaceae bacterium]|nr:VWA domain-containing protein [Gaiellaceae bacterium]